MRQVFSQLLSFGGTFSDLENQNEHLVNRNKLATSTWGYLRKNLFNISLEETTFARRGFRECTPQIQQHLERVGATFLQGYHAAIEANRLDLLILKLNAIEAEWRGFAFEGAAMGLALLDNLTAWKRNRVEMFLEDGGKDHIYMVHVGVGWVAARMKQPIEPTLAKLDPLLGWLAVDGYGFHEGYFNWQYYVNKLARPKHLSGYAARVFDQGLGRSLWFVDGADVTRIPHTIRAFPPIRRADLWSGIGLGCAYAGGVNQDEIASLKTAAESYFPQLAQGAAFAAKARQRAGNPTSHTEMACQVLCGMNAEAMAEITDITLKDLPYDQKEPAYEIWRQRIQSHFAVEEVTV